MKLKEQSSTYIPILTFLRGIASLGVAAVHMHYVAGLYNYPYLGYILDKGQLGVPIFFVISGFVIPYSLWNSNYQIKDFFPFILKRSVRIDPPYILVIMLCLVSGLFTHAYIFNLKQFLLHLLYLIPFSNFEWYQGVFWTLAIEFQFYILIGLSLPVLVRGNIYVIALIILAFALSGYFLPIPNATSFLFRHIHYFCIGIIILLFKKQRVSIAACHALILVIVLFFCKEVSIRVGLIGYASAVAILHINFESRITDFFGRISYSLYLMHTLTGELIIFILMGLSIHPLLLFMLLIACCTLNGYLFHRLIEIPALKWSKLVDFKTGKLPAG